MKKAKCPYFYPILLIGRDMAIFWPKMAFYHLKWQYLSTEAKTWKSKTTLLSSTLKVKEGKVLLFLSNFAYRQRYGHFLAKNGILPLKWQYLSTEAKNWKSKTTLFSSTLKIEESKEPLFLSNFACRQIFGHFLAKNGILPLEMAISQHWRQKLKK